MDSSSVEIAIVGAGPYGLSLAAHLNARRGRYRIFGSPMSFWSNHMPQGMCLKSEGFASNLYDPEARFTLKAYCAENNIEYADVGIPVPIEVFIDYAIEFQHRYVPALEDVQVKSISQANAGFALLLSTGEVVQAGRVVVATGIIDFAHLPQELSQLPGELVTHTCQQSDPSRFKGQHVAVLGAGASAVDMAGLLHQAGARVELLARRPEIGFHNPPNEPRPLAERIKLPRSGLGVGWRSRMCTDIPLVFHAMPESLRLRIVQHHLGPAPGWFVRQMVEGRVQMHLNARLTGARSAGKKVRLAFSQSGAKKAELEVDHVIAGTGYKVAISRLKFLSEPVRARIDKVEDTPILNRHFESSVPGLYFIGASAATSFGPLLRFAFGARFAARRVERHLARH